MQHTTTDDDSCPAVWKHPRPPDRMEFTEHLDTTACKYIASRTFEQFKTEFCTGDWKRLDGETIRDVRTYQRQVKTFCLHILKLHGKHRTLYKYGQYRTNGRIYTEQFGIQRLSKPLRDMLVPKGFIDYDMVNCHPTILLYLAKTYKLPAHYLTEYVADRNAALAKSNHTKHTILIMMNKDYNRPSDNAWTTGFVAELKAIKTALYTHWKDTYPQTNQQNPVSSCVNKLLCDFENQLLQTAIQTFLQHDDDCVPMFDGFMCSRVIDVDELNTLTQVCGVRWAVKEWTKRTVPDGFDAQQTGQDYETVKQHFEELHCMVRQPTLYMRDGEFKTKRDFEVSALEYQYLDEHMKLKDLFPAWIRDKHKHAYDKIVCTPYNPKESDPTPDNILNIAEPFKFTYIPTDERRPDAIQDFKYILEHICCSEDTQTYMLHFFAHLLQYPNENPQVAPIIKGHLGGVGKDSIIKLVSALLGQFWVTSVDDMERVFGKFNSSLDHKLLVQLNEADGSQGSQFISKIKGHVTADLNIIKEEHIKPRPQKNNTRYVGNSNNLNPFPYDRRLVLIQTLVHKLVAKEWWSNFYDNKLNDQHYLDSVGSDLLDIDLTAVNIMQPPETNGSKTKQMQKILPIHRVFQKLAEDFYSHCPAVYTLSNQTDSIGVSKKWLVDEVMTHCKQPVDTVRAQKMVDSWSSEYPHVINLHARPRVNGKQTRLVTMHKTRMISALKNSHRYLPKDEESDFTLS